MGTAGASRVVAVLEKMLSEDNFAVFKHRILLLVFLETTYEAMITYEVITRGILNILSSHGFFPLLLMKVTDNCVVQ